MNAERAGASRPTGPKRKRAAPEQPPPDDQPADDEANEEANEEAGAPSATPGRPPFARAYPANDALDALVDAFEAGNYARVRSGVRELLRATEDKAVRRAARDLRKRIDPDPLAVYLMLAASALLAFLAYWFWSHPHVGP